MSPSIRKDRLDVLAIALLLGCCAFWGAQQVLIKATVGEIAPVWQAALRFVGATALLWVWCLWRGVKLFERDGTLVAGLAAGGLFAAEFACIYIGIVHTTASRLTVFLYTSPFVVALLLPRFVASERLNRVQWVGLVCAFAAVVFAFREGLAGTKPGVAWWGDALALAAGVMWGLTTIVIRSSQLVRVSAEKLLFYQVAVSAVTLPPLALWLGEPFTLSFSSFGWASLIVQTVLGAFASYLVWMWMLGRYPATRLSSFTFLTPVFALVLGAAALGEPVTPSLLAALALVAVGIVLVNRKG
jgi:drug/metabolite transporter (DMT)-like permease